MAPPVTRRPAAVDARSVIRELVVSRGSDITIVLDRRSTTEMLAHDAGCAFDVDARIPGILGIDDDHGAVPALVHASRVVHAHEPLEPGRTDAFLERLVHILGALLRALLPRRAYEHVVPVLAHERERGIRNEEVEYTSLCHSSHWPVHEITPIVLGDAIPVLLSAGPGANRRPRGGRSRR